MTTYNTGNPIGSADPRDFYDNAQNLDSAINDLTLDTWLDRFGVSRKTYSGLERSVQQAIIDMANYGGLAYPTSDAMNAVPGTTVGQIAYVDASQEDGGTYRWNGSAWVPFYGALEYTKEQLALMYSSIAAALPVSGPFEFQDVVVDEWQNILNGTRTSDGRFVAELHTIGVETGEAMMSPEFAFAKVGEPYPDPNDPSLLVFPVIEGFRWNGTTTSDSTSSLDVYPKISDQGKQQVAVWSENREMIIGSAFNSYNPKMVANKIEYIEAATVASYKRFKEYPFSEFPVAATTITHVIGFGESLAAGTGSDPVLTTPIIPARVFMLNAGVLSLGREQDASAKNIVIDDAGIQFCIPAFSQIKESPVLAAAYQYAVDNPTEIIVVSQHGIGGAVIADMVRGNIAYDNLVHTASQVRAIAETNGATYKIAPISYVQGTNDWNATEAYYGGMLDTLWSNLNEDLKAVSGQSSDIVMVIEQTLSGGSQNDGSLGFVQIEHALANPTKFRCSNPRYGLPYVDNAHLTGPGYVNLGASQGFGFRDDYVPLIPISAIRVGTTVTVQFNASDLTLDTTSISNPPDGNYGFYWKDDTESAVISGVSLAGDTVTITLNQEPTGTNQQIRIADRRDPDFVSPENMTGTGKRCCLRTASLGVDSLGSPVYKRAAIFRINVTQ